MLWMALAANLALVGLELYALGHLRQKKDILKYYTFLQNFLGLIASAVCSVFLLGALWGRSEVPEAVRGLRYVTACGLVATSLIYESLLSQGNNRMGERDFLPGFSPEAGNRVLHYLCPGISLLSFLAFEREIPLEQDWWTAVAALPSAAYWILYLVLTVGKLWEPPYDFSFGKEKGTFWELVAVGMIPAAFVGISYVVWNLR